MRLLAAVAGLLEQHHTRYALIGAAALAAHGVSRSTFDLDLLTTDRDVLRDAYWTDLDLATAAVSIALGDAADPLVGVVRIEADGERPVDLIVGEAPWQERAIVQARPVQIGGRTLPVVEPDGLALLKLYAGGPQDLWDVRQLLAAVIDPTPLRERVQAGLDELPMRARRAWARVIEELEDR